MFVFTAAWKDLKRILRDPVGLVAWTAVPLLITALLSMVSGGGAPKPHGTLLVTDGDGGQLARAMLDAFRQAPLNSMITLRNVSEAEGRKQLNAGDASALLVIPAGFTTAFVMHAPSKLTLITNPAQRVLPAIIEDTLRTTLDGALFLQATGVLPRVSVRTSAERAEKPLSLAAIFFPGMLILAVFGLAQSFSEDIWRERSYGTLRRALSTPRSMDVFLAGKVLSLAVCFAAIAALGIVLAHFALGTEIHNFALAVLWVACAGVGLFLMSGWLQVIAPEERSGIMLNRMVLFVFGMAGGTIFPFELMPAWLAALGRNTPNGFFISHFKTLMAGQTPGAEVGWQFGGFAVVAAVVFVTFAKRLRAWGV